MAARRAHSALLSALIVAGCAVAHGVDGGAADATANDAPDSTVIDAGIDAPTLADTATPDSAPRPDSGHGPSTLPAPTQERGTTPAVFSCRGVVTAPAAGALAPMTMTVLSFGQSETAPATRLCFCPDDVLSPEAIAGTGCGLCQDRTTDASGTVSVMAHVGGWYAYRVFAHAGATSRTTFVDTAQVNETAATSAGGTLEANAVSALTANTLPAALLISRTPGASMIAGRVRDCDVSIRGAIVRAFHADGSEVLEGLAVGDPHYRFFDEDESPDASATFTGGDGLYVAANITPASSGELIRVETWANVGGVDERIGCEVISIFANGVSLLNVGPMRADYAAGHPCR